MPVIKPRKLARLAYRSIMGRLLRFVPRSRATRDVLLLCQNGLMADHLRPVWHCLEDDERLRFFVTSPVDEKTRHEIARIHERLPVTQVKLRRAYVRPWDLIITADHGHHELADRRRCPVMFTGHGVAGKVVDGEGCDYRYGPRALLPDGSPRYSRMLEASSSTRDRIVGDRPMLRGVVSVVGSLQDDALLSQLSHRAEIRRQLGYSPDDKVVFVLGSWGPNSLFHTIGDELVEAAQSLRDRFHFVLSVHPHEYRPTPSGERVWGEYLENLEEPGFKVRKPSESWIPYMVACDVVVSDHTALAVNAALAAKPMIHAPLAAGVLQEGTILSRLRAIGRVLDEPSRLEDELERALTAFPLEDLDRLAKDINSCPGQSQQRVRETVYELLDLPNPSEALDDDQHQSPDHCSARDQLASQRGSSPS